MKFKEDLSSIIMIPAPYSCEQAKLHVVRKSKHPPGHSLLLCSEGQVFPKLAFGSQTLIANNSLPFTMSQNCSIKRDYKFLQSCFNIA